MASRILTWAPPSKGAYSKISKGKGKQKKFTLQFKKGLPVGINGKKVASLKLIEKLDKWGADTGVGRGIHVGDTIMGIKGRIFFEAAAAHILIAAHRELEKLVLTKWQVFWKNLARDHQGAATRTRPTEIGRCTQ